MIDLGTLSGLHYRQHELHAYCLRCDRWAALDLASLVRQGKGAWRLPLRVRCRWCGDIGQLQVRPPTPTRSTRGWITPPTCDRVLGNDDSSPTPRSSGGAVRSTP